MDGTMKTDQEDKTRLLVDEIQALSADVLQQVAELLNAIPDEKLFGDTEFKVRDQILKLVAVSFNARLAQKKKRLSRLQHRLPSLRTIRQIPRIP
jgi:hypothetical protein